MEMGIDRSWASSLGGEYGWRREPRLGTMGLRMLTRLAGRLVGQAGEGRGSVGESFGLRTQRVLQCLPSLPHPIPEHQLPEQGKEQELVDQRVAYHRIPFPYRSNGGMLLVCRVNELSAG